eukprot:4815120-Prorocentrum_lima.AAC.1
MGLPRSSIAKLWELHHQFFQTTFLPNDLVVEVGWDVSHSSLVVLPWCPWSGCRLPDLTMTD